MDSIPGQAFGGYLSLVYEPRTDRPYAEEVPRLLKERGMSIRALARIVGVTDAHLSRVLRHADYKRASGALAVRTAVAFGLSEAYFPEAREDAVIAAIKQSARLRDDLFDDLQRRP